MLKKILSSLQRNLGFYWLLKLYKKLDIQNGGLQWLKFDFSIFILGLILIKFAGVCMV